MPHERSSRHDAPSVPPTTVDRRAILRGGTLLLAGSAIDWTRWASLTAAEETSVRPDLTIGLVTDVHYADKPPAGTRHYRETLTKLARAVEAFQRERPEFIVELGDFIDAADSVAVEQAYLHRIQKEFAGAGERRHYVLGNHCVDTLHKDEFLEEVGQERSYYSFDASDVHFIVLDACFRNDGTPYGRKNFHWTDPNVPAAEVEWLEQDLDRTTKPVVVFAHQRLDTGAPYGVKNAPEVRALLERSGRVLAVFQGHSHKNDYRQIGGIHYCTLAAMVEGSGEENNAYALADLFRDGSIRVRGFHQQQAYDWPRDRLSEKPESHDFGYREIGS